MTSSWELLLWFCVSLTLLETAWLVYSGVGGAVAIVNTVFAWLAMLAALLSEYRPENPIDSIV